MKEIHLVTHEPSGWEKLNIDGKAYCIGNPIKSSVWIELLKNEGYEVSCSEITDEDIDYY